MTADYFVEEEEEEEDEKEDEEEDGFVEDGEVAGPSQMSSPIQPWRKKSNQVILLSTSHKFTSVM